MEAHGDNSIGTIVVPTTSAIVTATGLVPPTFVVAADNLLIEGVTFTQSNFQSQFMGPVIVLQGYSRDSVVKNCTFTGIGDAAANATAKSAIASVYYDEQDVLGGLIHSVAVQDCVVEVSTCTEKCYTRVKCARRVIQHYWT